MALTEPPGPQRLRGLPRWRLAGRRLWRVYRTVHDAPWWFASLDRPPEECGRFDLPAPDGACYLPLDDADGWPWDPERLHDDPALARDLARYGITVERADVELPLVDPDDAGLWP